MIIQLSDDSSPDYSPLHSFSTDLLVTLEWNREGCTHMFKKKKSPNLTQLNANQLMLTQRKLNVTKLNPF